MRHGDTENRVLEMLRIKERTFTEIYTPIYSIPAISKEKYLQRVLKRLISKKMIRKSKKHYVFLRDYDVLSEISKGGNNYLKVNIPKINKTKDWKVGDKVKIEMVK